MAPGSETKNDRLSFSNPWCYPLLLCFGLIVLFGLHLVNDSDLGFHLRTGQWIAQNHRVPSLDAFTYTASNREYLDMEWLYQFGLYLSWACGGYALLSISHIVLALMAFFLLWSRTREAGVWPGISVLLFLITVLAAEPRFRVRPEILTWVFLSFVLWILDSRVRRKRDLLFLLPLIQLLWVNTEGLFFLGPVVMGIYLFGVRGWPVKLDPKLFRYSVLSALACLINPYWVRGLLFPLSLLTTLSSSNLFKYSVLEFQPPWSFHPADWAPVPSYLWAYKGFCFIFLILLIATAKSRKFHEWLLAVFFFLLSLMAVRNIPLFMIAAVPLAAACWKDLKLPHVEKIQVSSWFQILLPWFLVLFLAGFSARIVSNAHYVSNRLTARFGLGLDINSQPVQACRFLAEKNLKGKILNDLDDGDWLDWLIPQKTFVDGRLELMGKDFLAQYLQSQEPGGIGTLLAQYQPDIVLFNPLQMPQWAVELGARSDWRMVYLDSLNAVYLRKGYEDSVPAMDFEALLAENSISPSLLTLAPTLLEAEPPSAWKCFGEDFIHPTNYPNGLLNLGIFSSYAGNSRASELFFLEAIRQTHGRYPDFYYDLGLLYANTNRREEAFLCMERVLREKPQDPIARQIMGL